MIAALSRQVAVSPIAVIVIGESCLNLTSIEMIVLPFALSLTGTFTVSPGFASHSPKSNSTPFEGAVVVVTTGLVVEVVVTTSPTVI